MLKRWMKSILVIAYSFVSAKKIKLRKSSFPIAILDVEGKEFLDPLFEDCNVIAIPTRGEFYYINFQIFFGALKNLPTLRNPIAAYSAAVIDFVGARLVVTFIDNNGVFHAIKPARPKVNFLAIQNGIRCLHRDMVNGDGVRHNHFVCFGEAHEEMYIKFGASVDFCYSFGSLRDVIYRLKFPVSTDIKYDICLISEVDPSLESLYPELWGGIKLLVEYLAVFVRKFGFRICVATRADPLVSPEIYEFEVNFFEEVFQGIDYLLINNSRSDFRSYLAVDSSEIALCVASTLGLEAFGRGKKVFFFNATGQDFYNLLEDGFWALQSNSYALFEMHLNRLISVGCEEYSNLQRAAASRMMHVADAGDQLNSFKLLVRGLANDSH